MPRKNQRAAADLSTAWNHMINSLTRLIDAGWHQGDYEQIAAHLNLPVMTLDNIMRSYHVGPYDRRQAPRTEEGVQ